MKLCLREKHYMSLYLRKIIKTLENYLLPFIGANKQANYAFNMLIIQFTTISYENTLKFIKILLYFRENLPKTCKNNAFKVNLVKIMLYIRERLKAPSLHGI